VTCATPVGAVNKHPRRCAEDRGGEDRDEGEECGELRLRETRAELALSSVPGQPPRGRARYWSVGLGKAGNE
jgi:hypothetical protein